MCGFIGFTGECEHRKEVIREMADKIIHRGPDMEGYHVGEDGVTLGFRRLSIIDLSDGAQPMYNEDGTVVVVFNGEIYNFMELRDKLIGCGHVFRTRCDTEVIVHGWEEYGEKLIPMLRGMFAFVVWDTKTRTLAGARDYFGIKPFYYSVLADGNLLFGSEIKSFLEHPGFRREVNPDHLEIEDGIAILAVVGRRMKNTRGTVARVFAAMAHARINVKLIDQGSSELNVIIGVSENDLPEAIRRIYDMFISSEN